MDAEAYRKDYLAALKSSETGLPLKAGKSADEPAADPDIDRLMAAAADTTATVAARLEAIKRIDAVAFDLKFFSPYDARYVRLLKQLRTDRSAEIRKMAFRGLSPSLDRETREMLHQGLGNSDKKLIPDKAAVTLLGFDDHGSSRDILRSMAETAVEPVRRAALRGLAGDTRSAGMLERVATDPAESVKVRRTAALSLKVASPKRFATMAKQMVADRAEDPAMRAAAMSALAVGAEVREIAQTPRFAKQLDAVADATRSRSLKRSIKLFKALSN